MNLDTLLHDTAAVPDPTPAALASGLATMNAALDARHVVALRRRRNRRRGLIASLTAAAASLVLVVPTLNVGGSGPADTARASAVLLRAGAAAGAQPGGWPDAAYWHSVSTYERSGSTFRREIWIGHHQIGVLKDPGVDSGVIPLEVAQFNGGDRGLTWDELYALPTESHALEAALRSSYGPDRKQRDLNHRVFTSIGDLLRESPASPALRKALYEVAARLPGVTLVGEVTDRAGRRGVAVEHDGRRLVIDPSDGRLLEERRDGWQSTYLEQGPAATAPTP